MGDTRLLIYTYLTSFYASLWGRIASSMAWGKGYITRSLVPYGPILPSSSIYSDGVPNVKALIETTEDEQDPASPYKLIELVETYAKKSLEETFPTSFFRHLKKISLDEARRRGSKVGSSDAPVVAPFSRNNIYLLSLVSEEKVLKEWHFEDSLRALYRALNSSEFTGFVHEAMLALYILLSHWFPILPERLLAGGVELQELSKPGVNPQYPLVLLKCLDNLMGTGPFKGLRDSFLKEFGEYLSIPYYPDSPILPRGKQLLQAFSRLKEYPLQALRNGRPLIKDFLPFIEKDPIQIYSTPLLGTYSTKIGEDPSSFELFLKKINRLATELLFLVVFGPYEKNIQIYREFVQAPISRLDRLDIFNNLLGSLAREFPDSYRLPLLTSEFLKQNVREGWATAMPLSFRPGRSGFPEPRARCLSYEDLMREFKRDSLVSGGLPTEFFRLLDRGLEKLGLEKNECCFSYSIGFLTDSVFPPTFTSSDDFFLRDLVVVAEGFLKGEDSPSLRIAVPFSLLVRAKNGGLGLSLQAEGSILSGLPSVLTDLRQGKVKSLLFFKEDDPISILISTTKDETPSETNFGLGSYGRAVLPVVLGYSTSLSHFIVRPLWSVEGIGGVVSEEEELLMYELALVAMGSSLGDRLKEILASQSKAGFATSKEKATRIFGSMVKASPCVSYGERRENYKIFSKLLSDPGIVPMFSTIVPTPLDAFEKAGSKPLFPLSAKDVIDASNTSYRFSRSFDSAIHAALTGFSDHAGNVTLPMIKISYDGEEKVFVWEIETLT